MELRKLDQFEIEEAIIHVLDKNSDEPVLNGELMELSNRTLEFIGGHLSKLLCDPDTVKGKFFNGVGVVCESSNEILEDHDTFMDNSQRIAGHIFRVMKQYPALPSGDLLIVKLTHDGIPLLAVMHLAYQKSVGHLIDFDCEEFRVKLDFIETTLQMPKGKMSYGAIIQEVDKDSYDVLGVERVIKGEDGEPIEFFFREVLQVNRVVDCLDKTATLYDQFEKWLRKHIKNEMHNAIGIRDDLREIYERQVEVDINDLASGIIADQEQREKFIEILEVSGMDCDEPFELDKQFLEKKLKSRNIKTDTGFSIKGASDLFKDTSRIEIKYNGDGTVNYIIKNVRNISEK